LTQEAFVSDQTRVVRARNWYPWSHRDRSHPTVQQLHDDRTTGERVADAVARFGGSWPFIFLFVGMIVACSC
jgi:uncharacterized membrane protein